MTFFVALAIGACGAVPAQAAASVVPGRSVTPSADSSVVPGLSVTPSVGAVGEVVTFVASVTNATPSTAQQISLGVDLAPGLRAWRASGSAHCTPRNLGHLVYCNVGGLPPQETATITFTVTPTATGVYTSHTYARLNYTGPEADAYGTLTVS